jgi:hypothetical protein
VKYVGAGWRGEDDYREGGRKSKKTILLHRILILFSKTKGFKFVLVTNGPWRTLSEEETR